MWKAVLIVAILPAVAIAEAPGVKLIYRDAVKLSHSQISSSSLIVGETHVVTAAQSEGHYLQAFTLDGKHVAALSVPSASCGCFIGQHLYLATSPQGIRVLDAKDRSEIDTLSVKKRDFVKMAATPDGRALFVLTRHAPGALTIYKRDPVSGKLTKGQVFQSDEEALFSARRMERANPSLRIDIDPEATRVRNLGSPRDLAVSADGNHVFVASFPGSITVITRHGDEWRCTHTPSESAEPDRIQGIQLPLSVAASGSYLWVGGVKTLSSLGFEDGKLNQGVWWVDDSHAIKTQPTYDFLDYVASLKFSRNGRYLFLVSKLSHSVYVCRVTDQELAVVGTIEESDPSSKMLQVELSNDGKRLFASSEKCQLLVYELDERFTANESEGQP